MIHHLERCDESAIQSHADPWPPALDLEDADSCPDQRATSTGSLSLYQKQQEESEVPRLTSGGRHSSACRRSTENPPCVLVSEAVSVLQKEWMISCSLVAGGATGTTASAASLSTVVVVFSSRFCKAQTSVHSIA